MTTKNPTHHRRIAAGLCRDCGKRPAVGGVKCVRCKNRLNTYARDLLRHRRVHRLCVKCGDKLHTKKWVQCTACRRRAAEGQPARSSRYRTKIQSVVLAAYGGPRCRCCGLEEKMVLEIDHVAGGGSRHVQELGTDLYRWLIKNKFPPGFQVLCSNCNRGKYRNKGVCPLHGVDLRVPKKNMTSKKK